jgi:flagellar hook assembly protein FlgD
VFKTNSLVGIKDNAPAVTTAVSMTVYPNPVVDGATLSFTSKNKGEVTVRVYSLKGELVYTMNKKDVQTGKNTMNLETADLSNGTYIVKVTGATEGHSKFVVIR